MILLTACAEQQPSVQYLSGDNTIVVNGLTLSERNMLVHQPHKIFLQLDENKSLSSMLLTAESKGNGIIVKPRYTLKKGMSYMFSLSLEGRSYFETYFQTPAIQASVPKLLSFYPNSPNIPANTLRIYLTFSEPMARGQVRDSIFLADQQGRQVNSPFLNLETELWDNTQTRLTLLVDPGRIKQGVGPNLNAGVPLETSRSYSLIVSKGFVSAKNIPFGEKQHIRFMIDEELRTKVNPKDWKISVPTSNTKEILVVTFDRLMDVGASLSHLRIIDNKGNGVDGQVKTDGDTWQFTPSHQWASTPYSLIVSYEVEDVAGNTVFAPFDAISGTMRKNLEPEAISFMPQPKV